VELGPVGEHQGEGLAPLEAELGQRIRQTVDSVSVFAPGDLLPAASRTQRHPFREGADRFGERPRNRPCLQPRLCGQLVERCPFQDLSFPVALG
jgi:hypothetical protein